MLDKLKEMKLKDAVYILAFLGLGGTDVFQFLDFESKIHRDTEKKTKSEFVENVDSLRQVIANEEFAKGVFNEGVMAYKNFNSIEAEKYMIDVLRVADEAIANDSFYTYVEKPTIIWVNEHREELQHYLDYKYLAPMQERSSKKLYFNWTDDLYQIKEKNVSGGTIRFWRDSEDDQHSLVSISSIKDR